MVQLPKLVTRRRLAAAGGLLLIGAAVWGAWSWWGRPDHAQPAFPAGFEERAFASGLLFWMNFLPGEQGETFKTNLYDHGSGLAVGDYDGDGHDDVYFLNQLGPNALFRNKGDGTFEEVTSRAGVAVGDRICVSAVFADYDNDGDQDLYVTSTRGGNLLFRNKGDGTFEDVTDRAGLTHVGHSQAATFFDYDNDGRLDLLVINTAKWTTEDFNPAGRYYPGLSGLADLARCPTEANLLYRNNGDGTFAEVADRAGLKGRGWGADLAVFDYNADGFLDVLVTSMFGRSQLYRNNRDGTFTDVTRETLGRTSWGGLGARAFDFNNDGRLDLYIVDMHSDMWTPKHIDPTKFDVRRKYPHVMGAIPELDPSALESEQNAAAAFGIRYDEVVFGNAFFKNLGDGRFEEISDKAGLETFWPWGIAAADFDNDGRPDVFVSAGMGYPFPYWPNSLLMNNGDETFTDRAVEAGIEPPSRGTFLETPIAGTPATRSSRVAVTADFDGDGRLELLVNNFNDRPYYFKNRFPRRNYVAFRLRGTHSNRDAVGAVVRAYCGDAILTREVPAAGGYLAQSSKTVHFGLGDRTRIDRVEITWPRGRVEKIEGPAINTLHQVVEPPP